MEIKYVGFYSSQAHGSTRKVALAARNKMEYIYQSLEEIGYEPVILSPVTSKFCASALDDNSAIKWKAAPGLGAKNKMARILTYFFSNFWLLYMLVFKTRMHEKILVYHSPALYFPLLIAKKIKRLCIILEVEEIYTEVYNLPKFQGKFEKKMISLGDYFIFVSELLKNKIDPENGIILYGSYDTKYSLEARSYDPSKIVNILFSGAIETTKRGAFNALETVSFLPPNYILHITGYGDDDSIKELYSNLQVVNANSLRCIYHGQLSDEEYQEILNICSIALNTQREDDYTGYELPSKVIKYLSNNLRVVTTRSKSLMASKINDLLIFSENDSPKEIARTIKEADFSIQYDSARRIKDLNKIFLNELMILFSAKF